MPKWTNMLDDLISRVTEIGGTMIPNNTDETLTAKCKYLITSDGEATGLARSREILDYYQHLEDAEKLVFFQSIMTDFGVNIRSLQKAIADWSENQSNALARNIHFASEPESQELFRRLNRAPGGTARLVGLREDLIALAENSPELLALDLDLQHLFTSWFNRGFLSLEEINWSTPAKVLEKIITYEAVHEIHGWDDLRRRVAAKDRRLYAFFHPSLSGEPLIFVEVALTSATPEAIEPILSADRENIAPSIANTAVFYSISNCQSGLRGISFGSFLIKQVVEELRRDLPNLKRFITLSPVPSLRQWANANKASLDEATAKLVTALEKPKNLENKQFRTDNSEQLLQLAAIYLLDAKHKHTGPFDPVSRFHLGNGARLEQINLWADQSERGMDASWGVMVNYEYDLRFIEKNHESFLADGFISTSAAVKKYYKKA